MPKSKDATTFEIDKKTLRVLSETCQELGLKTNAATLRYALLILRREGLIPLAVPKTVFRDNIPVILTGEPGSGKSTLVKMLLMAIQAPAIIIDVNGEYSDTTLPNGSEFKGFRKMDARDYRLVDYSKPGRYRFTVDADPAYSKMDVVNIFQDLNRRKYQGFDPSEIPSGPFADWIIVIEEGHRFVDDPQVNAFIIEARKLVRKLIIVDTDWKPLEGKGKIMKPPPFETIIGNEADIEPKDLERSEKP